MDFQCKHCPQINLQHPQTKPTQGWSVMPVIYYFNLNKSLFTLQILGYFLKYLLKSTNLINDSFLRNSGLDFTYLHINCSLLLANPVYSLYHAEPFICPGQHFLQQMK